MNEPTEQEINRGIAEWMGWKLSTNPIGGMTTFTHISGESRIAYDMPSYTTSHDACHQALERMGGDQRDAFLREIQIIVGDDETENGWFWACVAATAHQKALAIYRVVKGEGR